MVKYAPIPQEKILISEKDCFEHALKIFYQKDVRIATYVIIVVI